MNDAVVAPHKRRLLPWLRALAACAAEEVPACLATLAHPNLAWHGPHPIGALHGPEAQSRRFWRPLKHAFPDLERRDDVLLGGVFPHPALGESDWVAATGHFVGTWQRDWLGLPATGKLAYLRFGEFHRVEAGRIIESRVLLDLPGLMRQAGCNPLPPSAGVEIVAPGPAAQDGVLLQAGDPTASAMSLRLAEDMAFGALRRADLDGLGLDGCCAPDLMRYGPCGLGATRGLQAFQRHHQRPFLRAFPDRAARDHRARVADGAYAAYTGWPGVRATHQAAYLGVAATGLPVGVRLMEFWRCEGGVLAESWSLLDLPHLLLQIGRDLMAEAREAALAA